MVLPILAGIIALPLIGYLFTAVLGSLFAGIFVTFFLGTLIKIVVIVFAILIGLRLLRSKEPITKNRAMTTILLIIGLLIVPFIINTGIFRGLGIASFVPILPVESTGAVGGLLTGGSINMVQDIGMLISLGLVFFLSWSKTGNKMLRRIGFNIKTR